MSWLFISDIYFSKESDTIKIEVDRYRIMVFPGLRTPVIIGRLFSMDLNLRSMFVEHQSTSGTKIDRCEAANKSVIAEFHEY
jgi:hypothetical protein